MPETTNDAQWKTQAWAGWEFISTSPNNEFLERYFKDQADDTYICHITPAGKLYVFPEGKKADFAFNFGSATTAKLVAECMANLGNGWLN